MSRAEGLPMHFVQAKKAMGFMQGDQQAAEQLTRMGTTHSFPMALELGHIHVDMRERAQGIMEEMDTAGREAALLGKLEGIGHSLATLFRAQDEIATAMNIEAPSWQRRLDLSILACASDAVRMLHKQRDDIEDKTTLQTSSDGVVVWRPRAFSYWNVPEKAALDVERARSLLSIATLVPVADDDKSIDQMIPQKKIVLGDPKDRAHTLREIGFPDNEIYTTVIRGVVRSVREGTIESGLAIERLEEYFGLAGIEEVHLSSEQKLLFASFAYINRARKALEDSNYHSAFGEARVSQSEIVDQAIARLTQANYFINARLPFLVDLDQMVDGKFKNSLTGRLQESEE